MSDSDRTTAARRDPRANLQSVRTIKGQHRTPAHSDRTDKTWQAWGRSKVNDVYPASYRPTRTTIPVNILGQVGCAECGYIPVYVEGGRLTCDCTVWNEGTPRPQRAPSKMSEAKRESQWRDVAKGRC